MFSHPGVKVICGAGRDFVLGNDHDATAWFNPDASDLKTGALRRRDRSPNVGLLE
jgi:hypothetical protein